jgi:hypothetical protein
MKKINIAYYVVTGLLTLGLGLGAVGNLMSSEESLVIYRSIGMPDYLCPFLGLAKILGLIAIWIPGYPRIKEWAYAGLFYDLLGATYGGIVAGPEPAGASFIVIIIVFVFASYFLYHKRLKAAAAPAS